MLFWHSLLLASVQCVLKAPDHSRRSERTGSLHDIVHEGVDSLHEGVDSLHEHVDRLHERVDSLPERLDRWHEREDALSRVMQNFVRRIFRNT